MNSSKTTISTGRVEDMLTKKQLQHIVTRCVVGQGVQGGQLVRNSLRPAVEGLAGFVSPFSSYFGGGRGRPATCLHLFAKSVPTRNDDKIKFITDNGFFDREITGFKLIEQMDTDSDSCVAKPLFYSDSVLVMPDLAADGYSTRNQLDTFDLPHLLVTINSVARFHAAFANYETKRSLAINRPYSLLEDVEQITVDTTFKDTPWIRTAARLTANMIQRLSKYKSIPNVEEKVLNEFLAGFKRNNSQGSVGEY